MTTELPDHPESREESYLADIAGQEVTLPEKPLSRKEQYLAYIAENGGGGGGGTNNFNQLTNRPKYNGTTMTGSTNIPEVKTYTAGTNVSISGTTISATDTKYTAGTNVSISDQNVISATDTTYSDFTGTDGTAAGAAGLVPAPATTDAGKFLKADGTWDTAGGGSSDFKVLSTADYNYPDNNPTSVALWLLEPGVYMQPSTAITVKANNEGNLSSLEAGTFVVGNTKENYKKILVYGATGDSTQPMVYSTNVTTGAKGYIVNVMTNQTSITQATGSSQTAVMSQKATTDLVNGRVMTNTGAPTTSTVGTVGQVLEDTTNGKLYICTAADTITPSYTWTEVGAGGGGSALTVLSTADYNYPADNPTKVALWLLDEGFYEIPASGVDVWVSALTHWGAGLGEIVEVTKTQSGTSRAVLYFFGNTAGYAYAVTTISDGSESVGYTRMLRVNEVVQTTGTSTTDVMSQNAVSSMVFADPSTKQKVQIGDSASAGANRAIGIGKSASATGIDSLAIGGSAQAGRNYSIALGAGSYVSNVGEVSLGGINLGTNGYNSSQYRLLTNVYDPQNAHDAATKGYVDGKILSGAGAPTTSTTGTVGQVYQDTTNGKLYICTAIVPGTDPDPDTYTWVEVGAGGGGGIVELTSADYNYPTDNPTSIALWLLDEGVYSVDGNGNTVNIKMNSGRTDQVLSGLYEISNYTESGQTRKQIEGFYNENGSLRARLEQVAGNGTYLVGINLTAPPISQSTGTSTTDVMSQNAVTAMVFADPSTQYKIKIGAGTSSSEGSNGVEIGHSSQANGVASVALGYNAKALKTNTVAIGEGSIADYTNSVAIGKDATPTRAGEVNIGSGSSQNGFNSSEYRVLGGLYDPQSAHDAATKGYVDPTTDSSAPTTATVGRLGQIFIDTTNADAYMCVAVDSVTPSYTWKKINA